MSILKRRAELLEELIASTAQITPGHDRFEALARSCKDQIDFHSFLDTHPDVVNAEYAQLKERLEDNAQFDKVTALGELTTRLQNLNLASSQLDFAARHLSFLLAASRNVLRTAVDPELLTLDGINNNTAADTAAAIHPSEWSDEEDGSDAEWWANEVAYSPDDGLSAWSGDDEEDEEDAKKDGRRRATEGGDAPGSSFYSPSKEGLQSSTATSNTPFITDPTNSPLTPLTTSRTAHRSPTRRHLSPQRRVKQPYSATSLAVWLAAKDSGGHPARQLDPRRCFTDAELVTQIINMLKGLQMPGLAFKFDPESESYKVCRGVHTSDLPPASTASLLTTFATLATHLRRIQTFCDAIVYTSTNYQLENKDNNNLSGNITALRALPTVAAFAAAVARQVVAIRGQLIDLETATSTARQSSGTINLLSLRLKLALMNRQVAALHAVVNTCSWKGTAACTASALLDTLYSVLETHLMRSGQHSGAISAMLVEIFCAAWTPLNTALDIWLSSGSLAAAPPEFFITRTSSISISNTNSNNKVANSTTFWSETYQLQRWPQTQSIAAPALIAPLAESLLHAGLGSVGLTLSTTTTTQQSSIKESKDTSSSLSLHTEFVNSLAALIEKKTDGIATTPTPTSPSSNPRSNTFVKTACVDIDNTTTIDSLKEEKEEGVCIKEWTAAVSRSPATAMVPQEEDLSDLSLFPMTALDLPEAFMCPETTALVHQKGGNSNKMEEEIEGGKKRHPVAVAMHMASAARAQQAVAGRTDSLVAAEFEDLVRGGNSSNGESFGLGVKPQFSILYNRKNLGGVDKEKEKEKKTTEKKEKIPSDAASWAVSLPLEVLTHICLIQPIQKRLELAEKRACEAILQAGLLTQLSTMETVAAAAGPVLEPFVQYLLRNSSTPRGVDGVSAFELNAALANALLGAQEGENSAAAQAALPGLASFTVAIAPPTTTTTTTTSTKSTLCSVSSLNSVLLTLHPSFPLNLIATDSFLKLHTTLWTLSLQLQWVAQSLIAARVSVWKESQKSTSTINNSTAHTRAVQQEMLHLVYAVRQHMLTHLESTGVRMRRGIALCGSLREMEEQCRVYEEEVRLGCLLSNARTTEGASAAVAATSTFSSVSELHSSLLEVLESSLRHCILLGHARHATTQLNTAKQAQLEAEDAEDEAVALEALEVAEQKLSQIQSAVAATEREFEGHRVAFMERVAVYGSEAGAHSDAARALLAAVDVEGRWQPPKEDVVDGEAEE